MKTLTAKLSLALGAVALLGFNLHAGSYVTKAVIPFSFQTTTQTLPAGTYYFQKSAQDPFIRLRDTKTGQGVFLAVGHDSVDAKKHGVLIFHRYGNEYFLAEIWPSAGAGTMVSPNRREKDLAHERVGMAMISVPFQVLAD